MDVDGGVPGECRRFKWRDVVASPPRGRWMDSAMRGRMWPGWSARRRPSQTPGCNAQMPGSRGPMQRRMAPLLLGGATRGPRQRGGQRLALTATIARLTAVIHLDLNYPRATLSL